MTLKDFIGVIDGVSDINLVELYIDEEDKPIYSGELIHLQAACDCRSDLIDFIFDCALDDDLDTIIEVEKAYHFRNYYLDKNHSDGEPVWIDHTKDNILRMNILISEVSDTYSYEG